MRTLVIVESPAKAKTIEKYLGEEYKVIASVGHIRDLEAKQGSIIPEQDFFAKYEITNKKSVSNLIAAAKQSDKIILAPDPDREGEAIAWHIAEVLHGSKTLKQNIDIKRVSFNAITKNAIIEAMKNPRNLDMDLVDAQQARRTLDYLVGFTISPVLWKKLPSCRSAGRVQSVALRLLSDRDAEFTNFVSQEYWNVDAECKKSDDKKNDEVKAFVFTLSHLNDNLLKKFDIGNSDKANEIADNLRKMVLLVDSIKKQTIHRRAPPPLITSTLQQEASRKLLLSPKNTMRIAQDLYEGIDIGNEKVGLITYMRTDSTNIESETVNKIRGIIQSKYGDKYVAKTPNVHKSKVKNAQEAHEAIRPTKIDMFPDEVAKYLDKSHAAIYKIIWNRAVASQAADKIIEQTTTVAITVPEYGKLRSSFSYVAFPGFEVIMGRESEDGENTIKIATTLEKGDKLSINKVVTLQHFTEPPPKYSEASLIKKLEELGIGRPSTYASIVSILQDRGYAILDKKQFNPDQKGIVLTKFLEKFFSQYLEYDYTAKLENELDEISNGKKDKLQFLRSFWTPLETMANEAHEVDADVAMKIITDQIAIHLAKEDRDKIQQKCDTCGEGEMNLKISKFGIFLGCSAYPKCKKTLATNRGNDSSENKISNDDIKEIGLTKDGQQIFLKKGPYGAYFEATINDKIKRISIKDIVSEDIAISMADKLMELPLVIGKHPEDNKDVKINIGKFGPYVEHNKIYVSIKNNDFLSTDLETAIELLSKKKIKVNKKQ